MRGDPIYLKPALRCTPPSGLSQTQHYCKRNTTALYLVTRVHLCAVTLVLYEDSEGSDVVLGLVVLISLVGYMVLQAGFLCACTAASSGSGPRDRACCSTCLTRRTRLSSFARNVHAPSLEGHFVSFLNFLAANYRYQLLQQQTSL